MIARFAAAIFAFAAVAVVSVGCADSAELQPEPPPTADVAEPEETPTPTPTPTSAPFVPNCYNIISAHTRDTLAAEGFVLVEEHQNKLRAEQRVETMFFENGGVDCLWGIAAGGDSLVVFGYSEITPAAAAEAQERLTADGYVRTEDGADVVLSIDPAHDVMGIGDAFVFADGEWFHSTTPDAIAELRENIELQQTQ